MSPNTKDLSLKDMNHKILVWGASGTGKTTFIGTMPTPIYVFDYDGGILSLRGKDVEYDPYVDTVRNGILAKSAWDMTLDKLGEFSKECPFATVALDSISTLETSIIARLCATASTTRPSLQVYGDLIRADKKLFLDLLALPCNIVVTAHEQVIKDEISGGLMIRPLIVGKQLPGQLPMFFDEVYRQHIGEGKDKEVEYLIHTKGGRNFTAKSRLGVLDPVEESDFQGILRKVEKSIEEEGGDE